MRKQRRMGTRLFNGCRILVIVVSTFVAGLAAATPAPHPHQQPGGLIPAGAAAIPSTVSSAAISVSDAVGVLRNFIWWGADIAMETLGYGEREEEREGEEGREQRREMEGWRKLL